MTRCVYLVGGPGVGKSALMDVLTLPYGRCLVGREGQGAAEPRREWLFPAGELSVTPGRPIAVELGARYGAHPIGFPGTDAMAMNAIVPTEAWLTSGRAAEETDLILGEGARLGVRRFVDALMAASVDLDLVLVLADNAETRRVHRGSNQKPAWVKGAFTRARRIYDYAAELAVTRKSVRTHVLTNDIDLQVGVKYLRELTSL